MSFLDALPDAVNPFAPSDEVKQAVANVAAEWGKLEPRMAADPKLAALLKPQHDTWVDFYQRWQSGDRDVTMVNAVVADVNVARRNAGGFDQTSDPNPVSGVDVATSTTVAQAGAAAEDYCHQHPTDIICTATAPQDLSWCQRAGFPGLICDKDGIQNWFLWALGLTGVALLGGAVYASYKIAPLALAVAAPEALPLYEALRQRDVKAGHEAYKALQKPPSKPVPAHVLRAVDEEATG